MQLPDEAISYQYLYALAPLLEEWTPAAELRSHNFVSQPNLKDLPDRLLKVRSQVAAERELKNTPPELQPIDAVFIALPQLLLDTLRRQGDSSILGRVLAKSQQMRE